MAAMITCDLCGALGLPLDYIRIGSSAGEPGEGLSRALDLCPQCSERWIAPIFKEQADQMLAAAKAK